MVWSVICLPPSGNASLQSIHGEARLSIYMTAHYRGRRTPCALPQENGSPLRTGRIRVICQRSSLGRTNRLRRALRVGLTTSSKFEHNVAAHERGPVLHANPKEGSHDARYGKVVQRPEG